MHCFIFVPSALPEVRKLFGEKPNTASRAASFDSPRFLSQSCTMAWVMPSSVLPNIKSERLACEFVCRRLKQRARDGSEGDGTLAHTKLHERTMKSSFMRSLSGTHWSLQRSKASLKSTRSCARTESRARDMMDTALGSALAMLNDARREVILGAFAWFARPIQVRGGDRWGRLAERDLRTPRLQWPRSARGSKRAARYFRNRLTRRIASSCFPASLEQYGRHCAHSLISHSARTNPAQTPFKGRRGDARESSGRRTARRGINVCTGFVFAIPARTFDLMDAIAPSQTPKPLQFHIRVA